MNWDRIKHVKFDKRNLKNHKYRLGGCQEKRQRSNLQSDRTSEVDFVYDTYIKDKERLNRGEKELDIFNITGPGQKWQTITFVTNIYQLVDIDTMIYVLD